MPIYPAWLRFIAVLRRIISAGDSIRNIIVIIIVGFGILQPMNQAICVWVHLDN